MLELNQKGLCNTFLAKLCPFDSFYISGNLVKLNVTGFDNFFAKLKYLGHILAWKFIYRYILIIATFL